MTQPLDRQLELNKRQEELTAIAKNHSCKCGSALEVAWYQGEWRLRCGTHGILPEDAELKRHKTIKELYQGGAFMFPNLARKCEKLFGGRPMESKELMTTAPKDMIARINMARFPQELNPKEKDLLAVAAISYGLDPLMGELTIYQGGLLVSIDGRRRKAQETGELDGTVTRPATKDEREAYPVEAGDHLWRAEVYKKGCSQPFIGWGKVTVREIEAVKEAVQRKSDEKLRKWPNATPSDPFALPLVKDPQGMAEKRAENDGLRKGFHLNLPDAESNNDMAVAMASATVITDITVKETSGNGHAAEHYCQEHKTPFRRYENDKGEWYSHKKPDGTWCNERKREAQTEAAVDAETGEIADGEFSDLSSEGQKQTEAETVSKAKTVNQKLGELLYHLKAKWPVDGRRTPDVINANQVARRKFLMDNTGCENLQDLTESGIDKLLDLLNPKAKQPEQGRMA